MKVYYWTPYMEKVGTIKATINSAIALKDLGHDVKIYKTYREWEGYEQVLREHQIEIIDFGLNKIFKNLSTQGVGYRISMILISIFSYGKLKQSYQKERPDIVISNLLGYLPLLARKHAKYKPKIVCSIQGKPYFHNFRKKLWKTLYGDADKIITLTEKTKNDMIEQLKFDENKFVVLPNPIIDESIDRLMTEQVNENFFKEDKKVILGIGRLTRQKDFSTLLKAFAKAHEKVKCCLIILGEGEEEKQLTELAHQLKVSEDVYMLGFVRNPFKYLANADVFVLSSLWEDAGHVLVEAAYSKIPIVSTRCPFGQEEFLEYGKAGELCNIGDVQEMSQKIVKVLQDEKSENRVQMVLRAHQNAMKYHITIHGRELEKILKEV